MIDESHEGATPIPASEQLPFLTIDYPFPVVVGAECGRAHMEAGWPRHLVQYRPTLVRCIGCFRSSAVLEVREVLGKEGVKSDAGAIIGRSS